MSKIIISKFLIRAIITYTSTQKTLIKNKNKQSYFFENVSGYFSNDFKKEIEKLETNDLVVVYDIQGKTMYKTYNCKNALVFTMK